ncbi:MAG TPA: redox-regulated ATPase YchF [Bacteroidia bacterium]|nr:redox-regulated ATPase YchF [Bacteroidia bacterium]HNT80150.1 redox-regulated ATPase YchF [Bacteroidia bacterium]
MGLKCGIVGLPNVGKSTLFNCLTNAKAQAANFPFCTIEPNIGVITVPDERLNELANLVNPLKIIPTTVEIVDIAGLVKGASKGEGLGNQFLANIRETDAIIHVVRCFENPNVVHVDGSVNPVRDKETIDFELLLKDLEAIEKRIQRIEKIARVGNDKDAKRTFEILTSMKDHLTSGKPARSLNLSIEDQSLIADTYLLTGKPVLYVCNVDEKSIQNGNEYVDALKNAVKDEQAEVIVLAVAIEADIAQFETAEERQLFLDELGLKEPGVNRLIKSAYQLLQLATYFTAGEKEVRAWTIYKGMSAPQAAGVIHTDFEKGFIRAEVIKYDDYIQLKSEAACKEAGKLSVQGKDYTVQDGDIMHFRFNV